MIESIAWVIALTLTYRLRGMGYAEENKGESIHKPIYWIVCVLFFFGTKAWWLAFIIGSLVYFASRPSLGEQYGKILGNFDGGFDTDWITNKLLPMGLREYPATWAYLGMVTRGIWYMPAFAMMTQYWLCLAVPFIYTASYVAGAYGYSYLFKQPLEQSWKGGEYTFGCILSVLMVVSVL